MNMVFIAFHSQDIQFLFLAYLTDKFFETVLDTGNEEDFPAVAGTENEMIADHGNGGLRESVSFIHNLIIHNIIKISSFIINQNNKHTEYMKYHKKEIHSLVQRFHIS